MNYNIGISGLRTAQRAIELIGLNIANASADGYHRQDPKIVAIDQAGGGAGSGLQTALRRIDVLLEQERVRQQPLTGQAEQELEVLRVVEGLLGELESDGLAITVSRFFDSLVELAANPTSHPLQQAVVTSAEGMTNQFNNIARLLGDLQRSVVLQAQTTCDQVNRLAGEIAQLNEQILTSESQGAAPNDLYDRRDQTIFELGRLVDVQVQSITGSGAVNVNSNELPLVTNVTIHPLQTTVTQDNQLGISRKDSNYLVTDVSGGTLGGLMTLQNEILPGISAQLDLLVSTITRQVNQLHVQGIGTAGSFTQLNGLPVPAGTLGQWQTPVDDGEIQVRLIDPDGEVTVHRVSIDADVDTVATVAGKLSALDPRLSATVVDASLRIQSLQGWQFDFLPTLTSDDSLVTGSAEISVSGTYTGEANRTFTARVVGTGTVGLTDGLRLELYDDLGNRIAEMNIGSGYPAGDVLEAAEGLRLAVGAGTLAAGDELRIDAVAVSDTSGFLAAAGINTLLAGETAQTMRVTPLIRGNPRRLAHAMTAGGFDNLNAQRMARAGQQALAHLGGSSVQEYAQQVVNGVAQSVWSREARVEALNSVMRQLDQRRDDISGVDINEEATKLLMFERMFQAMSRLIASQDRAVQSLMEII